MSGRGIDHLVVAVPDLTRAAETWRRLGFTTTPEARHPFGTGNHLVQFGNGSFIELVAVVEPAKIVDGDAETFSFAAFNRDWLVRHPAGGGSMIVVRSAGAEADRAAFAAAGLRLFAPFGFERTATGPDGVARTVAFSLTFVTDEALPDLGLFASHNHYPENFWKATFQAHANGGRGIAEIVVAVDDPQAHRAVFEGFSGVGAQPRGRALAFPAPAGTLVLAPATDLDRWGVAQAEPGRIAAATIAIEDADRAAATLAANGIAHDRDGGRIFVAPADASGLALVLDAEA